MSRTIASHRGVRAALGLDIGSARLLFLPTYQSSDLDERAAPLFEVHGLGR